MAKPIKGMTIRHDIKCSICGRFISYADLATDRAVRRLVTPDADMTTETWDDYHKDCENAQNDKARRA